MTSQDVTIILKILQSAYPAFYSKKTAEELKNAVAVWSELFENDDVNFVKFAVKDLIETHKGFPPDIGSIKERMKDIVSTTIGQDTKEEYWLVFKKAVKNSIYHADEEFQKLPLLLKKYVIVPETLKDYANVDEDIFNTVTRGQFLKQIQVTIDREETAKRIPQELKEIIQKSFKTEEQARLSEKEWNSRRNELSRILSE